MKPTGHQAVMAAHAPATVEADSERQALHRKLEFFPTPPWAARAGGRLIQELDPGRWWCWEPACGEGHMAHGLADYFEAVHATDIHDHGSEIQHGPPLDFLSPAADIIDQADWIVTNPPFGLAADFVRAGLRRARRGVAVLCRGGWLDTHVRHPFFYGGETPCDIEAAFFDRVNLALGRWESRSSEKGGSTSTAYSWFVWFQPEARPAWLRDAQTKIREGGRHGVVTLDIPPGAKAELTRPDDARRFGARGAAPLLDGLE